MLAGNSDIESVTFQKSGLEGVDDVVVHRSHGLPTLCVQVKHKKASTTSTDNLTFGALITTSSADKGHSKSLLASLAAGWKQVANAEGVEPEVVLYTNREMGPNRSSAEYEGKSYTRLSLEEFWDKVSAQLGFAKTLDDVVFSDADLEVQWCEFVNSAGLDEDEVIPFFKSLTIEAGAPSLNEKEIELTDRLRDEVCAGHQELASRVFCQLAAELRRWSTAAGDNVVTADVAEKCICKLNRNPLERPIDVPPPRPVFPSRARMCVSLRERLKSTKNKVVFLQGRPGSGKTKLVSYLCEHMEPRPIRFYAFKPLDIDAFSYSPDEGIVSPEELWSTLLNQLRDIPELSEERPRIPIINEICSADELREEVLRLADILSDRRGSKTVLVIDGIDHAARAADKLTFLKHLPSPKSIPEGVQMLVSGQPASLYSSYPQWLKGEHASVEVVDIPNIDREDVSVLLKEKASFSSREILVLTNEIINMTKGNPLSVVYAVHAIADETDCDYAINKLRSSGPSENIEEYYESIWQKANEEIQRHHGNGSNALSLIAASMHLLDGAIYPKLLNKAFPEAFSGEYVARQDIKILSALMRICEDGSAWPVHNDFRIFVRSKVLQPSMKDYLNHASKMLANAVLRTEDDVVKSCYAIRLLSASKRIEECVTLFDTSYVINAVAHGISWRNLCDQAKTVYEMACKSGKLENVFRVQLALSTLSQINEHFEYWLERRPFLHFAGLVGMDYVVPPLSKTTAALYATMLGRCLWLLEDAGCAEQSDELYNIWFSGLAPSEAAIILSNPDGGNRYSRQEDDLSLLMSAWGEFSAAHGIACDELTSSSDIRPDAEKLLSDYRAAYVRSSLKWCRPEDDVATRISGISITEDAAADMMRDILSGALPASYIARCAFFSKIALYSFERSLGTLAYALCLSEGLAAPAVDRNRPLLCSRKGSFYDRDFTLGLFAESFVFGYESNYPDFEPMVLDMQTSVAWVDDTNREYLSFIRALRASACLGYSMGHDKAIRPGTKGASVLIEWGQAQPLPGSLTIETCAISYLLFVAKRGLLLNEGALENEDLEPLVFSSRPLCTKLRILEYLQRIGSNIPRAFLQKTYGPNGMSLLVTPDAAEVHEMLRPLLLVYDGELALHCDEAILFGSARLTDHKDYALSNLVEVFGALFKLGMVTEPQAFSLLELDNAASQSGGNGLSDVLMEAVADWAVSEGPAQLSRVRSFQAEFKYDYSLIEYQLKALLSRAESLDDVLAVFAGLFGHTSCCSSEDLNALRTHIEICQEKAINLGLGNNFVDEIADIRYAIKDAPLCDSPLPDTKKSLKKEHSDFSALTDEEVKEVAFYQQIDSWHWESIAGACSELVRRGFEKSEVCNALVETRVVDLVKAGWSHYSAPLSKLVNDIAAYADDASYFKLLSHRNERLTEYGFGSTANDIAHVIMVRAQSKFPEFLGTMFELECDSKRRWITCNGRCDLPVVEQESSSLPEPKSLAELVTDILLDSVVAHDPHRTENAVRGISWGGLRVEGIRSRVCEALPTFDSHGRMLLEKILDRWMCAHPQDNMMIACLSELIYKVQRADEALVLSAISGTPGCILGFGMKDPKPIGSGHSEVPSCIENFLLAAQMFCDDDCMDVKETIRSCCREEVLPFIRRYMHFEDVLLPIYRLDEYCQELLYAEMSRGRWRAVPFHIAASTLVDPADAWVFSQIPIAKDPSAIGLSDAIELFETGDVTAAQKHVESLPIFGLNENELCLGWKLYIPYGDTEEYEYCGTARMAPLDCIDPDNVIDRELGCYGLLSFGIGGDASLFSKNSISLCNELAGVISMMFCDCEIIPSFVMRKLGFEPRSENPLVWINNVGKHVAWFEQFSFPVEKGHRPSAYYRQPRLWRWVCNKELVERAVLDNGYHIYWATRSSSHIDPIARKREMTNKIEKMSPFEKEIERRG